jgi:hypothetical protein
MILPALPTTQAATDAALKYGGEWKWQAGVHFCHSIDEQLNTGFTD